MSCKRPASAAVCSQRERGELGFAGGGDVDAAAVGVAAQAGGAGVEQPKAVFFPADGNVRMAEQRHLGAGKAGCAAKGIVVRLQLDPVAVAVGGEKGNAAENKAGRGRQGGAKVAIAADPKQGDLGKAPLQTVGIPVVVAQVDDPVRVQSLYRPEHGRGLAVGIRKHKQQQRKHLQNDLLFRALHFPPRGCIEWAVKGA